MARYKGPEMSTMTPDRSWMKVSLTPWMVWSSRPGLAPLRMMLEAAMKEKFQLRGKEC
jgi:hypothetical protein